MRIHGVIAFVTAAACHGLLLFGIHMDGPARMLPQDMTSRSVEVTLVAAPDPAPVTLPADPARPEPVAAPEPPDAPFVAADRLRPTVGEAATPAPPSNHPLSPDAPVAIVSAPPVTAARMPTPLPGPAPGPAKPAGSRHPVEIHGTRARHAAASAGQPVVQPGYRSNPPPRYPAEARRNAQQGVVLLRVEVDKGGCPRQVTLKRGSGFPLLDAAAIEAVRHWTFTPAQAGGLPAASRVDVPVRFSLERR